MWFQTAKLTVAMTTWAADGEGEAVYWAKERNWLNLFSDFGYIKQLSKQLPGGKVVKLDSDYYNIYYN